ncbi:hypothetical protein Fmac_025030 [Flemingia macrophylla]|uniref:Uncharacterized protein n=1 Tax=Flemingia macrophylla TaxID=520843 RepID=A0ABD1LR39_9FABA
MMRGTDKGDSAIEIENERRKKGWLSNLVDNESFLASGNPDTMRLKPHVSGNPDTVAGSTVLMPRIVNSIQRICARGPTESLDQQFNYFGQETHNNAENAESDLRKAEDVVTSMLAKGYILGKRHRKPLMHLETHASEASFIWRLMRLEPHVSKVSLCLKHHASEAASLHLKPHVSRSSLTIAKDVVTNMLDKGFDENHQLSSKVTTKVVHLDQKVGLSEKISAGTILPHASETFFVLSLSCVWSLMRLKPPSFGDSCVWTVMHLKPPCETHNNDGNPESYLRKADDAITNMLAKCYILGKEHRSKQNL